MSEWVPNEVTKKHMVSMDVGPDCYITPLLHTLLLRPRGLFNKSLAGVISLLEGGGL